MFVGGSRPGDLRMRAILEGFGLIRLGASHLSEREIYQGLHAFQKWVEGITVPLVSTNILRRKGEEPLGKRYLIHELELGGERRGKKGPFRIAVLGLNRMPKWADYTMHAGQFLVRDPAEAAALALKEIQGKADFVVALVYMPFPDARRLAERVPGIDLILSSFGGRTPDEEIQGIPIVYSQPQGAEIAEVRLFARRKEDGWNHEVSVSRVLLTERYPLDPEAEDLVDRTLSELEAPAD